MWDLITWGRRSGARWFDLGGITAAVGQLGSVVKERGRLAALPPAAPPERSEDAGQGTD